MLFSSLTFLFVFLPLALFAYHFSRKELKNIVLLFTSILFYAWGGVSYCLILLGSIIINYWVARNIQRAEKNSYNWLKVGLVFNVFLLLCFKYLDFFIENLNVMLPFFIPEKPPLPALNIVLPLGISFFTFQQMSMLWDLHRNKDYKKVKLLDTALYVSLFPQLIAGPIVRYKDIIEQIYTRKETIKLFSSGVQKFTIGLFKKVVLANTCALIADSIMACEFGTLSAGAAWLGIIAYSLQIYFDFSGYSDMAIGLCRMFGFRIMENFNFPYISKSIKEFWRRWHISLSSWFRDYVYIPLGGNRKGQGRTYFNLLIVFLLTGFWHGATWSFVIWGIYHGFFLILERLGFDKVLAKIPAMLSWGYTMLVVIVGWVFFRVEHIADAGHYLLRMFGVGASGNISAFVFLSNERLFILALALISSSTIFVDFNKFLIRSESLWIKKIRTIFSGLYLLSLLGMFLYAIILLNAGSYNPFIYFRF